MPSPTISFTGYTVKGNEVTANGAVDYKGAADGKVVFYADPLPSGTPFGPSLPVAVGGALSEVKVSLGFGKWRIRLVASSTGNPDTLLTLPDITISPTRSRKVLPGVGGAVAASGARPALTIMDPTTRSNYRSSRFDPAGGRRLISATAVKQLFNIWQRLRIFRNGVLVVSAEYQGECTVQTIDDKVILKPGVQQPSLVLANADINSGNWFFIFQGAFTYRRAISGSVGPVGSGKDLVLSDSPTQGAVFGSDFGIMMSPQLETAV